MKEPTQKTLSYQKDFNKAWLQACKDVKKGLREQTKEKSIKGKPTNGQVEGYAMLGNAVIETAVHDWRASVKQLRRNKHHAQAQAMLLDCERFFLSEYFNTFTPLDGRAILDRLIHEESTTYQIATSEIKKE